METLRNEILEIIKATPKISFVDIVRHFTQWERSQIHEQLSLMSTSGVVKKSMDKGLACYEAA